MRGNSELPPACPLTSLFLTNFSIALTRSAAVGTSGGACRAASKDDCKTRTAKEKRISERRGTQLGSKPHTPKLQLGEHSLVIRGHRQQRDMGVVSGVEVALQIPCEGLWSVTKYRWSWFSLEADRSGSLDPPGKPQARAMPTDSRAGETALREIRTSASCSSLPLSHGLVGTSNSRLKCG